MPAFHATRLFSAPSHKRAMSSLLVNHGGTGEATLYVSLDHIGWRHPVQRLRYFDRMAEHITSARDTSGVTLRAVYVESPQHPRKHKRKRHPLPTIIAKIIGVDGTEQSFGPLDIDDSKATAVSDLLAADETARLDDLDAERLAAAKAEAEQRNADAEVANQARIDQAVAGIDPDTGEERT